MSKSNLPVLLLKNLVLLPLEEARIELNNDVTKKIIDISKKYFNDEGTLRSDLQKDARKEK